MESFTSLWKLMETDGNSWMFFKKWKFKDFLQMDGNSWKLMFKETQRKMMEIHRSPWKLMKFMKI